MIGVANEQAKQEIQVEAAVTTEKDMAVKQIEEVRQAEITKDVQVVKAKEEKEVTVVNSEAEREQQRIVAEGYKDETELKSQGDLTAKENEAKGIKAVGEATADAKLKLNMADVEPEITLAQEIGENEGYQNFLNTEKAIKANESVGVAAATALAEGDLKVIVNEGGSVNEGVNGMMNLFNGSNGGTQLGAIVDGMMNTEGGGALLERLGVKTAKTAAPTTDNDNTVI